MEWHFHEEEEIEGCLAIFVSTTQGSTHWGLAAATVGWSCPAPHWIGWVADKSPRVWGDGRVYVMRGEQGGQKLGSEEHESHLGVVSSL